MAVVWRAGEEGREGKMRVTACRRLCSHFPTSPPPAYSPGVEVRASLRPAARVCVCAALASPPAPAPGSRARGGPGVSAIGRHETSAAVRRRGFRAAPAPLSTHVPAPAGRSASVRVSMPGRGGQGAVGKERERDAETRSVRRPRARALARPPPPLRCRLPGLRGSARVCRAQIGGCGREACRNEECSPPPLPSLPPSVPQDAFQHSPPLTQENTKQPPC